MSPPDGPAGSEGEGRPALVGKGLGQGKRTAIGVAVLALLGALAWSTMEAGRMRTLVMVVLAGFALRLLLLNRRSRYDGGEGPPA